MARENKHVRNKHAADFHRQHVSSVNNCAVVCVPEQGQEGNRQRQRPCRCEHNGEASSHEKGVAERLHHCHIAVIGDRANVEHSREKRDRDEVLLRDGLLWSRYCGQQNAADENIRYGQRDYERVRVRAQLLHSANKNAYGEVREHHNDGQAQ